MDALGLLETVLAIAIYPGLAFLIALGLVYTRQGWSGWGAVEWAIAGCCAVTTALIPLPGTPISTLPPTGGSAANGIAIVMVFAVACALSVDGQWSLPRVLGGVAATVSLVGLMAAASTTSVDVVFGLDTRSLVAARTLTACALLLALPVIVGGSSPRGPAACIAVAGALIAFDLMAPALQQSQGVTLLVIVLLAVLYAVAWRVLRLVALRRAVILSAAASAAGLGGLLLAIVPAHP